MAKDDSSDATRAPQMTPNEMRGLAARLRARAKSVLMKDQPEQQRDLLAAANLILQYASLGADVFILGAVLYGLVRLIGVMGVA